VSSLESPPFLSSLASSCLRLTCLLRYAAKTLVVKNPREEENLLNEVKFLRQHRHPFIVNLHDVFICTPPR
jgi:hypothetical protein